MAIRRPKGLTVLFTAQDVARFCEVDLKTVHHWADRGKIRHFRTEGRHLRFRRNDLVRFLRGHGYPLPDALTSLRPRVVCAVDLEDLAKKLGSRFSVGRVSHGIVAVARIADEQPDALVLALDDPTLGGAASIGALKRDPSTSWVAIAALADPRDLSAAIDAGADVVVATADALRLPAELARCLGV